MPRRGASITQADIARAVQPDPTAPMRLAHAAAMFGLTVSALRTEARHGRLAVSRVAGKDFVTKAEIERMFERCQLVRETAPRETVSEDFSRAHAAALANAQRLKDGLPPISTGRESGRFEFIAENADCGVRLRKAAK
jgi:hypothetical protein